MCICGYSVPRTFLNSLVLRDRKTLVTQTLGGFLYSLDTVFLSTDDTPGATVLLYEIQSCVPRTCWVLCSLSPVTAGLRNSAGRILDSCDRILRRKTVPGF